MRLGESLKKAVSIDQKGDGEGVKEYQDDGQLPIFSLLNCCIMFDEYVTADAASWINDT